MTHLFITFTAREDVISRSPYCLALKTLRFLPLEDSEKKAKREVGNYFGKIPEGSKVVFYSLQQANHRVASILHELFPSSFSYLIVAPPGGSYLLWSLPFDVKAAGNWSITVSSGIELDDCRSKGLLNCHFVPWVYHPDSPLYYGRLKNRQKGGHAGRKVVQVGGSAEDRSHRQLLKRVKDSFADEAVIYLPINYGWYYSRAKSKVAYAWKVYNELLNNDSNVCVLRRRSTSDGYRTFLESIDALVLSADFPMLFEEVIPLANAGVPLYFEKGSKWERYCSYLGYEPSTIDQISNMASNLLFERKEPPSKSIVDREIPRYEECVQGWDSYIASGFEKWGHDGENTPYNVAE